MERSDSKTKVPETPNNETQVVPEVEDLLRQILRQVGQRPTLKELSQRKAGKQEVLEVNVDGVNYTLSRSAQQLPSLQIVLSPREKEIIRLIASGLPNKAIANVLNISPWTV